MNKSLKTIGFLSFLLIVATLCSCKESDDTEDEFPNWQANNDTYFTNLYNTAKSSISTGSDEYKIFRNWSLVESAATEATDHIVVKVLETGKGSGCPLFTDSCQVHYMGKLIPSTTFKDGFVFDKSYSGDYNPHTAAPTKLAVSSVVDGFATALQNMHIGDRWRVYMPYKLGYGTVESGSIPAFSTLIFEITLVGYYRAGTVVPPFKAPKNKWIFE